MGTQSILVTSALTRYDSEGLTEVGVQSSWLAQQCYRWELACEGGVMDHTVLRAEDQWTEG